MTPPQLSSPCTAALLVTVALALMTHVSCFAIPASSATSSCLSRQEAASSSTRSTSPTMTAHRHQHHLPQHGKLPDGSSKSAPIVNAPPKNLDDGAGAKRRRRRRRPMIGPAVWAAFKEEQRGVTRALLGLPDEKEQATEIEKATTEQEKDKEGRDDMPAAAGKDGAENETIEEELRRRKREREQKPALPRTTLGTFMSETRSRSPDMEAMVPIMKSVGKTCIAVSRLVRRAQIEGMAGLHHGGDGAAASGESLNVQGEVQKELDVLSNSIFLTGFCQPADMSCVASEEEETPRMCATVVGEETHGGEYAAVFDPLDGSANIEAGLPCGTIFGILRVSGSAREGQKAGPSTIVLPGRRLVAAGYCLYGPSTKLVFTLGAGVFEFTLQGEGSTGRVGEEKGKGGDGGGEDGGLGGGGLEFVLTRSNIRIPKRGNVYSVNEANSVSWSEAIQDYFQDLKRNMAAPSPSSSPTAGGGDEDGGEIETKEVEGQYAGALVADIHNILIHGGVFAYPADVRNPNGKLRLLYEGNPMAMIVEEAGGVATTGFESIRDVRPQSVHHRIPAFFGSPDDLLPLLNPRYLHSKR